MVEEFIQKGDAAELRELATMVRRFATQEVATSPSAVTHPGGPPFERTHFDRMGALGLSGSAVPEQFGGTAVGTLGTAATIFEIARAQLGPAIYLSVHLMVSKLIALWHNSSDLRWHPLLSDLAEGRSLGAFALTEPTAGSDAAALRTRASREGDDYLLSGEKIYITSAPHADLFLVFARTHDDRTKGISAFVVERSAPGAAPRHPGRARRGRVRRGGDQLARPPRGHLRRAHHRPADDVLQAAPRRRPACLDRRHPHGPP